MEFVIDTPGGSTFPAGYLGQGISVGAAATPVGRTILMIVNAANITAVVKEFGVQFNGVTATNAPVLVELVKSSQATNGTNGAVQPAVQWRGQGNASGTGLTSLITGYAGYVSEPTVLTSLISWLVPPTSGLVVPFALGDEPELIAGAGTMGLGIRVTPQQPVSAIAYMRFVQGPT